MANVTYGNTSDFVFKEAVEFLKTKVTLTNKQYKALEDQYKSLAFSVEGYTSLEILETFLETLQEAATNGETKESFQNRMNTFLKDNGYEGLTPQRANTIFLTNIQTAFNVGHYKSMTEPQTLRLRPYWQYQTAGDGRERPSHAEMADRVYRADDPIWSVWYPPNGFGCRCTVVTLSERQVQNMGLPVDEEIPYNIDLETGEVLPIFPDKGFSSNPAQTNWQPDLSGFPEVLKEAYKERQNKAQEEKTI